MHELEPLILDLGRGNDPVSLRDLEWLVTNGLGGFASGTVFGIPTRHYHGLFVPNLSDPKGRHVVVPRVDELVELGERFVNLAGAEFADGRCDVDGHRHLRDFRLNGSMPVWHYDVGDSRLEKSIVMPHGENTVCLRYRLLDGPALRIRLRLFVGKRRADSFPEPLDERPFVFEPGKRCHLLRVHGIGTPVALTTDPISSLVEDRRVDEDVLFRVDRHRGYDHCENQYSPGYFELSVSSGQSASLVVTTEGPDALEIHPDDRFAAEAQRLGQLLSASEVAADDAFARRLVLASDPFIVLPGSRRDEASTDEAAAQLRSVMAGYHWFNDWGRDTMISLEGLTLCTKRYAEARAILQTFAHYIRDGLVPNLFPEGGREALYHTVDATLWYFHALDRYLQHQPDLELLRQLYPSLQSVIRHHLEGTRFGIGVDPEDCLLRASAEGYQLTWMDAKVDDWVVTPRRGKPVEIQALWFNVLRLMDEWADALADPDPRYLELAERVRASFGARYWSDDLGHLYDVIDGPDGDDPSLRPNQIFTMSLRHPVLERRHWGPVLDVVERKLLTPMGLRTLAPDDPSYQPFYQGSLRDRDGAYHQGTVWPWLLGHYVDAWIGVHGDAGAQRRVLLAFPEHLHRAGVGSISEVFDAESPHLPRGCIAQAWSVAEILRAWLATGARDAAGAGQRTSQTSPIGKTSM
jgi:predicted glycogen debranching enzyme